jgi:hypothetical protein
MNAAKIEPMIIEQPGVPGKLRSQTLDEYMAPLIPEHPARAELAQLRAMALEGMKSANALSEALQKIQELQKELERFHEPVPIPEPAVDWGNSNLPTTRVTPAKATVLKVPCPYCGKEIATQTGGWKSHYRHNHADQPFIAPPP